MVEEASLAAEGGVPHVRADHRHGVRRLRPTSGLAANPLIGQLSDLIVKEGGTSILSETTEFIGAEHILARRAINKEVHDRIFEIVHNYEKALQLVGRGGPRGQPPLRKQGRRPDLPGGEVPGLHPQGRPQPRHERV